MRGVRRGAGRCGEGMNGVLAWDNLSGAKFHLKVNGFQSFLL